MGKVRVLAVVAAAIVPVAFAPDAQAELEPTVDSGIVQTVEPHRLVLRALDGSSLEFNVDAETRVVVNGVLTRLAAIRPGFVAEVLHRGTGRALRVRAFGRFAEREVGVVVSIARRELVLERDSGGRVTIPVTRRTIVRRGSVPVGRWAVRPGRRVTVILAPGGSARAIVLRRQQA